MNNGSNGRGMMQSLANSGEITCLLNACQAGSSEAQAELWTTLYSQLRNLARGVLRRQRRGARYDATSLVHDAYLRLFAGSVRWQDRQHFFAVAARAMRFVLTDEARRLMAKKRGEGEILAFDSMAMQVTEPSLQRPEEVLAIHQALHRLAKIYPRCAKLVELRYFAGLSVEEAADALDITTRTVVRDWKTTRIWLLGELRTAEGRQIHASPETYVQQDREHKVA